MDNPLTPKKQKTIHKHACSHTCDTGLICTRTFHQPSELRAHERFVHLGIYDHVCVHELGGGGATAVLCDKKFERKYHLVQHGKEAHSDKKPFICEFVKKDKTLCKFACKSTGNMNRHKQTHLEVKRYKCTLCPESFGDLRHLRRHDDRIHKCIFVTHKCPDCIKEYSRSCALERHRLYTHADRTCPKVMARIETQQKKRRENNARRYANDREFRLKTNMSGAIRSWLKRGGKQKGCKSSKLLMMSVADIIIYLEKNSVSGLKYGDPFVEVDHIKPQAAFKKFGPVEQRECWCYLNLQLLTAKENKEKSDIFDQAVYDTLDTAKEIAVLRVGWVSEFGETEGPEIIFDENDVGPSNAEGDGAVYEDDSSSDSDDHYCIGDEDGSDEYSLDEGAVHVQ
jgi:hypothetical protein